MSNLAPDVFNGNITSDGFEIELCHIPSAGTYDHNHPSENLIYLSLVPRPVHLIQVRDGKKNRGLHHKDEIAIAPAGFSHWTWDSEDRYLLIHLANPFLEKVALEALDTGASQIQLKSEFRLRDVQIQQMGNMLLSELNGNGLGGRLYVESLMNVLTVHLLRQHSTITPRASLYADGLPEYQLTQVFDYINEYLSHDIKLTELSALLDMSQFHFGRRFKQSMGLSPHQYLIKQRVERAKQLLKSSNWAIADIAIQSGFNSQSHLGKAFRELTGVTPSRYRKSL